MNPGYPATTTRAATSLTTAHNPGSPATTGRSRHDSRDYSHFGIGNRPREQSCIRCSELYHRIGNGTRGPDSFRGDLEGGSRILVFLFVIDNRLDVLHDGVGF